MKKTKTRPYLSPCMKINSKWTKDLNVRPEVVKFYRKENRDNLGRYRHWYPFLNRTPFAQKIRAKIDIWDCIKLKSF
jgi:hypothetical protein